MASLVQIANIKGPRGAKGEQGGKGDPASFEPVELGVEDLDTVTTPGYYYQTQSAEATLERHYPVTQGCSIRVSANAGRTQVQQEVTTFPTSKPEKFWRNFYAGSWSAWRQIVDGNDARLSDARTPVAHTHSTAQVTGLDAALLAKADKTDPRFTDARTPTAHTHAWADVTGKPTTFAPATHQHPVADVTGLQAALDGKVGTTDARLSDARAPLAHAHAQSEVTGLTAALDAKVGRTAGLIGLTDNLDAYTTGGSYYQISNSSSTPERNYPINIGGRLDVSVSPHSNGWVQQEYTTYSRGWPRKWSRNFDGTGWGAWIQLIEQTSLNTSLALKANTTHTHDDRYYTEAETDAALALKAASVHAHDDRYYTQAQVDTRLDGISTAYQVAQSSGFAGTMQEWLASLVGPRGVEGPYGGTSVTDPQVASYVTPGGATGTAIRDMLTVVDVRWFGAVGDGIADDTAALTAAFASNRPLHFGGKGRVYRITQQLTVTLAAPLAWHADGATIRGDFPQTIDRMLTINSSGHDVTIVGALTIDAANKAHSCIRIWNRYTIASLLVTDLTAMNAYRASTTFTGGEGMDIAGIWSRIDLIRPTVKNIIMAAGAGVSGSRGVSGINIYSISRGDGTSDTPHVVVVDSPYIENIYSEDPAWLVDQDAIKLFGGNDEVGQTRPIRTTATLRSVFVRNARGRAVKTTIHYAMVDGIKIVRDKGGVGITHEIDFQTGGGTARNIECEYVDGNVPKSVVNFSGASTNRHMPQRQVAGLKVNATGTVNMERLVSILAGGEVQTLTTVSDVTVHGAQPLAVALMSGFAGGRQDLVMSNVIAAPVNAAVVLAGGTPPSGSWNARIAVSSAINTGAQVPLVSPSSVALATVASSAVMGYTT